VTTDPTPVFLAQDGSWMPTGHARGPLSAGECHGGAPSALLARELERLEPGADTARIRRDGSPSLT
jgi:hypothetical protein